MSLQDIKYVLSVDDKAAKTAISRTVKDLKSLDNTRFGDNGNSQKLVAAISAAGDSAGEAIMGLGSALGAVFGGSVLGNSVGDALSSAIGSATPAITGALAGVGVVGGGIFAKKFALEFKNVFRGLSALNKQFDIGPKNFGEFKKFLTLIERYRALTGSTPGPVTLAALGPFYELKNELPDLLNDFSILRKQIAGNLATAFRTTFSLAANAIKGTGSAIASIPSMMMSGFQKALSYCHFVIYQMMSLWDLLATTVIKSMMASAKGLVEFLGNPIMVSKRMFSSLNTAAGNAWTAIRSISLRGALIMSGAVVAGIAVITAAFGGIAAYANKVWSEVEDGIMATSAALAGLGKSIDEAFSDDTANKIMGVADTLATGLGAMPSDIAAATSMLVKNGMDLDQALSRMAMVQNIATINNISSAEAAEKLVGAWNGELKVLKDLGIRMKSTGDLTKDAELAMAKLVERYGDPALSKPFIEDAPMKAASAAVTMLWAKLGQALDPAITAAWQAIADVILGIAESFKENASGKFIANAEGLLAAIGATVQVIINATIVVSNVFQMVWTGLKSMGQSIWYGAKFLWNWIQEKLAALLGYIGQAVSLIPGTGDAGSKLQETAKAMQASAAQGMKDSGKAFTDAAMSNFEALKIDAKDIMNALAPDGGAIGDLQRKGQAAREKANAEAMAQAQNPKALGESEKVREERERKAAEEAEKRAKKERQILEQNDRLARERNRMQQQRTTIVLQTPQRMIPALRHAR